MLRRVLKSHNLGRVGIQVLYSLKEGSPHLQQLRIALSSFTVSVILKIKCPPTPVLLPGKSCGRSSLEGCSPWGCWGSDMTKRLHFHFSLSCTGEGNGNPFQYSCLENPRDGGAWWAAIYGVAQSQWLSSSNSKVLSYAWKIVCIWKIETHSN